MARLQQTARPATTLPLVWLSLPAILRWVLLPLSLALLAAMALFIGYQRPSIVTLPADDYHTRLLTGFNKLESNEVRIFRWTNGDASVCVPRTGYASSAFVYIQLLGSAPLRQGISYAELQLSGGPPVRVPLRDGDHWYSLMMRPGNAESGDSCLRIRSDSFTEGTNPRRLGVPFGALRLELWTPGGVVWPPLDLLFTVGLLAALGYLLLERLTGNLLASSLPIALLIVVLLGGVYARLITITFDMARMLVIPLATALYLTAGIAAWAGFRRIALPRLPRRWRLVAVEVALIAFGIGLLFGGRELAQFITGHHSFYPLKAGVWPNPNWLLVWPALFYGVFLLFVLKALRHDGPLPEQVILPALVIFAAVMPVVLKVSVRGWSSLLYTYSLNPADYIHDVWRIGNDLRGFLGQYVDLMPDLRLHNRNHPPGSVVMLWAVERLFGAGPIPATVVTVLIASTAVLPVYWLARGIGGQRLGLVAAAIYAVIPGHQIYTVTSMDAVFNTTLAWALWAFWVAMRPDGRWTMAVLAGLLLAIGLGLTFATLTLGIFGIAVVGFLLGNAYRSWREPAPRTSLAAGEPLVAQPVPAAQADDWAARTHVLRQAALVALALVLPYLLLYFWSGFNIVASILAGTRNNFDDVQQDLPPSGLATYVFYILVNLIPFMWYLSFWGLPIVARTGLRGLRRWGSAQPIELLAGALLIQIIGLALCGLFTREVERIWGFTYPLVAIVVAGFFLIRRTSLLWAAIGITQFFLLSAFFRTWLNTYW